MKIPSAGTPISFFDLFRAWLPMGDIETFQKSLQNYFDVAWCGVSGSGTSAIYATLLALRKYSDRTEVILPAYTAPSLILPIRKAGLNPVLCEVSVKTLNSGANEILSCITEKTLAVMPVHMFGLPTDIHEINRQLKDTPVFTIEDACSSMGAAIDGAQTGTRSDVGIFSFNRGKNMSTFTGGVVLSDRTDLIPDIQKEIGAFPKPTLKYGLKVRTFATALSIIVRPWGYSLLHPIASRFKYTSLHTDFHTWAYSNFQARLGKRLLENLANFTEQRENNAATLRQNLAEIDGILLPEILQDGSPAHNQFPILLSDEEMRNTAHQAVLSTGLEATLLYPDPIHRLYNDIWDGTGPDPFPNASDISQRLMLIPVHPLVPKRALERAVDAIKVALT